MKTLTTILLAASLIACGDDDDDVAQPDADNSPDVDAAGASADAPPAACLATADYGSPTLANVAAGWQGGTAAMPNAMLVQGDLNADAMKDLFVLELYKGSGAFMVGEIVPGTYPITGAELNYRTCGVCPRLLTDLTGTTPSDDGYVATGGSVTITQVSPNLAGSVSNLTFQHVTIDAQFNSTPHADGCQSALTAVSFDVTPQML
jgi:hypothetical protein